MHGGGTGRARYRMANAYATSKIALKVMNGVAFGAGQRSAANHGGERRDFLIAEGTTARVLI
jgi:hypothetical protein